MNKKLICLGLIIAFIGSSAVTIESNKYFEIAKNLEIFTSIYKELNANYVDELDPNTVMRTGIDAMMDSMDPYTVYYSESQVESYRINLDNKYDGLGASSMEIDGKVTIVEVYKDGPSDKVGVAVGDEITSINGQTTKGRTYEEVIAFLRGYPGTNIQIGIFRPTDKKKYNFNLTRSQVDIPNVPYSGMINDQVGYISLTTFTQDAGKNIARALRNLRSSNDLQGVVLDLRDNGGGLLGEAIDILGIFLSKDSPVVTTKGKVRERDQSFSTRRTPIDTELPIVVLINKSSASASEIVSGAIQDYDRGVVMGQRSYGKGLVQNQKEVGYNSRIKLTTSKYYIPSGRCIQSVEYENGEPKDVADDKREVFKTRNGRPVLDGGGVTPDVKLALKQQPDVLKTLLKEGWLFKFVNQYIESQSTLPAMEDVSFDAYEAFRAFLKTNGFEYKTEVEEALEVFLGKVDGKKMIEGDVEAIITKVDRDKADDLSEFKPEITREIEIELAKRFHFQEGKAFQKLKNDTDINEAIRLLTNIEEYNKLLK